MTKYAWTAAELYELVKDLPEEARPKHCHWIEPLGTWLDGPREGSGLVVLAQNAVSLHVAALTIWLMEKTGEVCLYPPGEPSPNDEDFRVCWGYTTDHAGPTLLHALVAAAKEVGK